jgi:hypothetical protein
MSEDNADAKQLKLLRDKLAKFMGTLSNEQKALLDTILKLTQEITAKGNALDLGFDRSFSPDDAALSLFYADRPDNQMIKSTIGAIGAIGTIGAIVPIVGSSGT